MRGRVYAVSLADWSKTAWPDPPPLGIGNHGAVTVLVADGKLYAGSNGWVYELDPSGGAILHQQELAPNANGAPTSLATDGSYLYAGVTSHVYAVSLATWTYRWSQPAKVTDTADLTVNVLAAAGHLYAGTDGTVFELRPADGEIVRQVGLSSLPGSHPDVRLASDESFLFAGTHGYAYGIALDDWSAYAWYAGVGSALSYLPVSVASSAGRLFAGTNGYLYDLDPRTGAIRHSLQLTYGIGVGGDYDTSVQVSGRALYAGVHGYSYRVLVHRTPLAGGTLLRARRDSSGWHGFDYGFDSTPPLKSVCALNGAARDTDAFAVGADGILYHNYLDSSGWHGWTAGFDGAPEVSSVFAVYSPIAAGRNDVFAIGPDGTLYHDYYQHLSWHGWTADVDNAPKVASVFALPGVTGNLEVFAITPDGTLLHNDLVPDEGWQGWVPRVQRRAKVALLVGH